MIFWRHWKKYLSPLCAFCREDRDHRLSWICSSCRALLVPLSERACVRCGRPFDDAGPSHACAPCLQAPPPFAAARSLFAYDGALREHILAYKYHGKFVLEAAFQELVSAGVHSLWDQLPFDGIIPIPADPRRGPRRGYNPPLRWGLQVARERGVPLYWREFARRPRPPQTDLAGRERRENLRGVFYATRACKKSDFRAKQLLILDDVWTTGSTMAQFAAFLREECAVGSVYALTLARR